MQNSKFPKGWSDERREAAKVGLKGWDNFTSFKITQVTRWLDTFKQRTLGIFSGNQGGKTASVAYHYIKRLLGKHPIAEKNKLMRKVRCMSPSLPIDSNPDEQDNTQYLELKRLIPYELIEKDITARSQNLVVRRPLGLSSQKTIFEFKSSQQEMQKLGRVQLSSLWHDEETPKGHREECRVRLLKEGGDEIFSLTPTNSLCFDEATEILTKSGWKRFNDVTIDDPIMTYNMGRDLLEWKSMSAWHVYAYDGEMVSMKNKSFDFLVTPNHRWVVCNDRRRAEIYLEESQNLNTKHIIKRIAPRENNGWMTQDNPVYEDSFIALAGWMVTDGTVSCNFCIYQSKTAYPEKCAAINELVKPFAPDVRYEEHEYGPTVIDGKPWDGHGVMCRWTFTYDARKRLASVLDGKSLKQDFICSLSKRQLEILFNAMVDGDGYTTTSGGVRLNQTGNEPVVDDFQLIATLLGRLSHKGRWVNKHGKVIDAVNVYANSERFWPNTHVKSLKIKRVPYKGFVWCPTSKNGTVVVRRNGCVSISGNSYTFDEIWQQAAVIVRSKIVADMFGLPEREDRNMNPDIACMAMATDDNPTLDLDEIDRLFEAVDIAEIPLRRYGVFKQTTGRIHKTYDPRFCFINFSKYFPDGVPYQWTHTRGIDYHESRTPWSVGWMACSPENEWFLWKEAHPAIDGPHAVNTYEIAVMMARKSDEYRFTVNLIDALAKKKQANSNTSVVDDLNRHFDALMRTEGLGTPCFWEAWDTKGTTGRGEVMMRFKNAAKCGKPFNNLVREKGMIKNLPTLWICDTAPKFHKSIMNWRFGEHVASATKAVKDAKGQPQQKFSHDNMVLECLAKDYRILNAAHFFKNAPRQAAHGARSVTGRQ